MILHNIHQLLNIYCFNLLINSEQGKHIRRPIYVTYPEFYDKYLQEDCPIHVSLVYDKRIFLSPRQHQRTIFWQKAYKQCNIPHRHDKKNQPTANSKSWSSSSVVASSFSSKIHIKYPTEKRSKRKCWQNEDKLIINKIPEFHKLKMTLCWMKNRAGCTNKTSWCAWQNKEYPVTIIFV